MFPSLYPSKGSSSLCILYSFFLNENIILSFVKNTTLSITVTLVRTEVHFDPLPGELHSLQHMFTEKALASKNFTTVLYRTLTNLEAEFATFITYYLGPLLT